MANKSDFDSWIVSLGKKYLAEHPERKITIKKTVEIPLEECEYCGNGKPLFEIPFSDTCIKVSADKLSVSCSCGFDVVLSVNFCPICGRKTQHND